RAPSHTGRHRPAAKARARPWEAQGAARHRRLERDGQDHRRPRGHAEAAPGLQEDRPPLTEVPRARRDERREAGRRGPHRRDASDLEDEVLAPRRGARGGEVASMSAPVLTTRALERPATHRIAASSVAPVASRYERSLRPSAARVSTVEDAAYPDG